MYSTSKKRDSMYFSVVENENENVDAETEEIQEERRARDVITGRNSTSHKKMHPSEFCRSKKKLVR